MPHSYFRVRDNAGIILDGATATRGVEALDGQTGVADERFSNSYGFARRVVGALAKRMIALARKRCPSRVYHGGLGMRPDDVYQLPVEIIAEIDPDGPK